MQPHDVLGIYAKAGNSGRVGKCQSSISLCCGTQGNVDRAVVTRGPISRIGQGVVYPEVADVAGVMISTLDVPGESNMSSII